MSSSPTPLFFALTEEDPFKFKVTFKYDVRLIKQMEALDRVETGRQRQRDHYVFDLNAFPILMEHFQGVEKKGVEVVAKAFNQLQDQPIFNITLKYPWCQFVHQRGAFPLQVIDEATSFFEPDFSRYSSYQSGEWDGKVHLFKKIGHSNKYKLRAGLWERVKTILDAHQIKYYVVDKRQGILGGYEVPYQWNFEGTLWEHQEDAFNQIIKHKRGTIRIAMGGGKSILFAFLIYWLKVPTVVFIHSLSIGDQLYRVLGQYLGEHNVGFVGRSQCKLVDGGCNVILLPTAYRSLVTVGRIPVWKKDEDGEWREIESVTLPKKYHYRVAETVLNAKCVIYDEGHRLGARTYDKVSRETSPGYSLLFSATPYRNDGRDLLLEAGTGQTIINYGVSQLIQRGILMKPLVELYRLPEIMVDPRAKWPTVYRQTIVENELRNELIVDCVNSLAKNRVGIVTVAYKRHGERLASMIRKSGIPCRFVYGEHTEFQRSEALESLERTGKEQIWFRRGLINQIGRGLRVVVSTIFGEGIDIPPLGFLVRAKGMGKSETEDKPHTDVIQSSGRVLRRWPPLPTECWKLQPIIVDFLDSSKWVGDHADMRELAYRSEVEYDVVIR